MLRRGGTLLVRNSHRRSIFPASADCRRATTIVTTGAFPRSDDRRRLSDRRSSSRNGFSSSSLLPSSSLSSSRHALRRAPFLSRNMSGSNDGRDGDRGGPFVPWPRPVVESNGDYRAEAHLESLIGGPLYSAQSSLPRLPVPPLRDTVDALLPTALPLAKSEEEGDSFLEAAEEFASSDYAGVLQRRLEDRAGGEMGDSSWLQLWWNTLGYLQVRDPVVVNVSYFFQFSDDATIPPSSPSSSKSAGVRRAASLLAASSEYRRQVCSGSIPYEAVGRKEPKTPLCSAAFKYMFHACRVPRRVEDAYKMYDPSRYEHVVVACGGRFFSFDFVDKVTGEAFPLGVLEDRLQRCADMSGENGGGGGTIPMLGYLTSDNRDSWADARDELIQVGGTRMDEALEVLESGALMICLDENEEPSSKKETAEIMWTGGLASGRNRWYDKSIQIIVTKNGKAGMAGEHSMMDGMPVVGFCDHITKVPYADRSAGEGGADVGGYESAEVCVKDIFADCAEGLTSAGSNAAANVEKSKSNFEKLITDHELHVQNYTGYGSNLIKKMGYSPDAYVQMAMQVATYRLWDGEQGGTYEATQVRPFLHGRTDTTRTVSPDSAAFVKAMGLSPGNNDGGDAGEKVALLRDAVTAHVKYIGKAAKAQGVDRHLLGLALSVKENETAPSLFSHPLYAQSKRWRVSTSHLTHSRFDNWGYGEVVPDGVGLAYSIHADRCTFCITSLKEHGWTERLSGLLEEALAEMRALNEVEGNGSAPSSKL